ncbi:MAG: hypothetical protein EOO27_08925 [Comamonadaceae bacterium]|nr:MAG: hypothetical protein EOO27_08925 [Comamonadaceae bacterium]
MDGSVVCGHHGGTAPQVIRRAAERVQFTADDAAKQLVAMMSDPSVDPRERIKIAQDLLDRAGLAAAQVHKVLPITEDPIEKLFTEILQDEQGLMPAAQPQPVMPAAAPLMVATSSEQPHPREAEKATSTPPSRVPAAPQPKRVKVPRHIREALDDVL